MNGTDDDSTNAGDNIRINAGEGIDLEDGLSVTSTDVFLYEEATVNSTDDITSGTVDAGGRIMSETSYAPSGQADRVIFSTIVKKLESKPLPRFERNLLLYLAETPFGSEPCGITLESGSGNLTDNIILDGQIPFNEGSAFMELERDSEIDNIILDGTDSLGSDAGDGLVLETGFFLKIEDPSLGRESETFRILFEDDGKVQLEASIYAFPVGFRVSDGDKLLLDTLDNDDTITLSDIGSLSSDINTPVSSNINVALSELVDTILSSLSNLIGVTNPKSSVVPSITNLCPASVPLESVPSKIITPPSCLVTVVSFVFCNNLNPASV